MESVVQLFPLIKKKKKRNMGGNYSKAEERLNGNAGTAAGTKKKKK